MKHFVRPEMSRPETSRNKMIFNTVHGHGQILTEGLGYSSNSVIVLVFICCMFQISPKYLHSNSTSHTWPFSAVAELIGKILTNALYKTNFKKYCFKFSL